MSNSARQPEKVWVPVEQDTIPFYGHDLVAVRLEDGRIAAVLRWLCEGLHLDPLGQLQRIERKTALAEGLLPVLVQTDGGPQTMPALTLDVLPGYLFTINEHRVNAAARPDVILFQRLCAKVLAAHFTTRQTASQPALLAPLAVAPTAPSEPPTLAPNASPEERRAWRQLMREWLDLLDEFETWRANVIARQDAFADRVDVVELRVDAVEDHIETVEGQVSEIARLMPEIMEKFGAQPLSPEHQAAIQRGVNRLNELTGAPHAAIYNELRQQFKVGKYSQIPDARWPEVVAWFRPRIRAAGRRVGAIPQDDPFADDGERPEQASLF